MTERYYARVKRNLRGFEEEPFEYKTVFFDDETDLANVGGRRNVHEVDIFLRTYGWTHVLERPPVQEDGLTPTQAADRINWLINNAGQQLEYGVVYDWEKEIGDVVKLDQRSIETLREISRVARELANYYEGQL